MDLKDNYKEKILNRLLDLFENRKVFKTLDFSKNNIYIDYKDKLLAYYHKEKYRYLPYFSNELDILTRNKLIFIKYDKDEEIERIYLNLNNIDSCYEFVSRTNKVKLYNELVLLVNKYLSNSCNMVVKSYLNDCLITLNNRVSYADKFKNSEDLILILKGIKGIIENKNEILIRNFSVKIFSDSKYFENNINKFFNIFNTYYDKKFENIDDFLNYFNIYKNPKYSYIKNGLVFKINNTIIDLDDFKYEFSLTNEEINNLEIIKINKRKILTIENLTTFHYFSSNDYIVLYLGGFSSSLKIELLRKIKEFDNTIQFYHFSDLDVGGFNIYFNLVKRLNTKIIPFLMNEEIFKKYLPFAKPLTNIDKNSLVSMLNLEFNPFKELIKVMLKENKKLEQESIDIKEFK